ncbi:MAG TPA: GNAT family N-acetyltransferase [Vicinamibacterales bacterium]|nr:GNAT family N-acetyltransferase [Vicinamibacterales bacterium]
MSSYRFCRTDDVSLLVDALNHSWSPHFPGEPAMTPETFKRSIRDLQVWCSSCMVAFAGADPIAVLIGAKRTSGTLIHKIAVHPDHLRQGHGRHLLTSLSSKLSILGPPRMFAEVPENNAPTRELFAACGYVQEAVLTDYVFDCPVPGQRVEGFVIPVTVDDLAANDLLPGADQPMCWERSVETLTARKDETEGLAVASDERIEAFVLRLKDGEILSMRSFVEDDGARLKQLLSQLSAPGPFRIQRVHPAEFSNGLMDVLGFRPAGVHVLYAAKARSA